MGSFKTNYLQKWNNFNVNKNKAFNVENKLNTLLWQERENQLLSEFEL